MANVDEATLELGPGRVTLFVFGWAPLARLQLGAAVSDRPEDGERWSVTAAAAPGELPIRLVAADGRVFEQRVRLVVARP